MKEAVDRGVRFGYFLTVWDTEHIKTQRNEKLLTEIGVEWHEMLPIKFRPKPV